MFFLSSVISLVAAMLIDFQMMQRDQNGQLRMLLKFLRHKCQKMQCPAGGGRTISSGQMCEHQGEYGNRGFSVYKNTGARLACVAVWRRGSPRFSGVPGRLLSPLAPCACTPPPLAALGNNNTLFSLVLVTNSCEPQGEYGNNNTLFFFGFSN